MAYINKSREWPKWLKQHRNNILECGIPEYILETEKRWYIFLDHQVDEVGLPDFGDSVFSIESLNSSEASKLKDFITVNYPNEYDILLTKLEKVINSAA